MKFKASPVFLALALSAAALIGCAQGPTVPTVGTTMDEKSYKDFFPTPTKDMKWVYTVSTSQEGSQAADLTLKVTEVSGDTFTYESTFGTSTPSTHSANVKTPLTMFSVPATTSVKSEGSADIKVGDKEYKGTAKVAPTTNTDARKEFYWLAAGTGIVKAEVTQKSNDLTVTMTAELKSFNK